MGAECPAGVFPVWFGPPDVKLFGRVGLKELGCCGVVGVGGSDPPAVGVTALGCVWGGAPFFRGGYFRISAQRTNWNVHNDTFLLAGSRIVFFGFALLACVGVGGCWAVTCGEAGFCRPAFAGG